MSKNLQNNGKGLFPNSFNIKEIRLERFDGNDAVFIQPIVTKLIINESIYTNSLTAEISIKDTVNLFGSFPIIGNEKITIKIVTDVAFAKGGKRTINLDFYVTDVPVFGRGREPNVQAFVLSCISPHAYISSLKQLQLIQKLKRLTNQMKQKKQKKRNPIAALLKLPQLRKRVIKSKKLYNRSQEKLRQQMLSHSQDL